MLCLRFWVSADIDLFLRYEINKLYSFSLYSKKKRGGGVKVVELHKICILFYVPIYFSINRFLGTW
jgi:hypothetical protein